MVKTDKTKRYIVKTPEKTIIIIFLLIVTSLIQAQNVTKTVRGTFINFTYQDEIGCVVEPMPLPPQPGEQ